MAGHIEKLWLTYREILPRDAGNVQVMETKRAFFAGARSLLSAVMGPLLDADADPTPDDLHRMAEIDAELEAFARSGGRI